MPIIYLSPSTQEKNEYVNGGTEEQYMNLLADKMIPYLDASGIRYTRNTPDMTAASSIAEGERAATIIANNLKEIYPLPELVQAQPTTTIGEVRRVRAPSAFLELGYHDNPEDSAWIKSSLDPVAKNLVMSLTDYFDIPFLLPQPSRPGQVDVDWGVLNIRARPELGAPILVQAPDGAPLTVLNSTGDWYLVDYYGTVGYARQDFITLT